MRVLRPMFAVGVLALLAGPALAQDRYATLDVRAGYMKLMGSAGDTLKGQSSFGAGAHIALGSRLHLGLTADWAHHSRRQADGSVIGGPNDPQWNVLHGFLKVSFDVASTDKITFALNAGPGLVVFSPNDVLKDAGFLNDAHFAANIGASLTYWFSDRIGLLASPQLHMVMKKTSGQIFTDKSAMFLPLTGGFVFKI
jgi:hypothetical protein